MQKDKMARFPDFALRVLIVTGILGLLAFSYAIWSAVTRSFVDPRVIIGFGLSTVFVAGGQMAVGLAARRTRS